MSGVFCPSILATVSCLTVSTSLAAARVPGQARSLRSGQCWRSSNLVRGAVEARFAPDGEASYE